ncbi:MAG: hypothetical protein ACRELG_30370 [Gemmataceae bacterium]
MAHWHRDPDLVSVRGPALNRLADNERAAWQSLWRDVDELLKRLTKKDEGPNAPLPPSKVNAPAQKGLR